MIALSSGDRRRQEALKAGKHLLECSYCAELSEPLIERRSSLAAAAPVGIMAKLAAMLKAGAHSGPVQATAGATTVAGVAVAAVLLSHHPSPPPHKPQPSPTRLTTVAGKNLLGMPRAADLQRYQGRRVEGHKLKVAAVPADEGFWIDAGGGDRIWVQIGHHSKESNVHIGRGDRVDFVGRVMKNGPNFAHRVGVDADEGAWRLNHEGFHIAASRIEKVH